MEKIEVDSQTNVAGPALHSSDILSGLGAAPRSLLATCLALFEDSTLQQRLRERAEDLKQKITTSSDVARGSRAAVTSLQERVLDWTRSSASDQELRLVLWMRLREALGLLPATFCALRAARTVGDDLVAATLDFIQPGALEKAKGWFGWGSQREVPTTLDALARQTMQELVESVLGSTDDGDPQAREALMRGAKEQVEQLDAATRDRLLRAINAREFNDEAIRTLLLTGGGLAAFGGVVSAAGFSAYILAAQASAFIPLVSGPALVSFVAVLSNPITIVLATAGMGVWATRSANQKIQAAIAMRVIALLALSGIAAGEAGLRTLAQAFPSLRGMRQAGTLPVKVLTAYQADWDCIAPAHGRSQVLDPGLAMAVDQAPPGKTLPDRWRRLVGSEATQDMAGMSLLTVGELLYLIQALDPEVLEAADFARVEDLSNPVAFAAFAHRIDGMNAASHLGAISNLKGYVAEQMVASRLVDQGHVVEFPSTSNQAGWDLSVDGVKFQVKNAADLDLLHRHFEKGYSYPILANSEVADLLAQAKASGNSPEWADHVHFVEGYSSAAVQQVTTETLNAGDDLLHPHVPMFAITIAAIRQLWRYQQGQVTGSQAIQDVLVTGTVGAGLAVAGNYVGVGIGMLVFGPAGALVLGSALPVLSRTQVSRTKSLAESAIRGDGYRAWEAKARQSFAELLKKLCVILDAKEALLLRRASSIGTGAAYEYVRWRLEDDLCFLHESRLRLEKIRDDERSAIEDLGERALKWLTTCALHPVQYQDELRNWLELLARRPTLNDSLSEQAGKAGDAVVGLGRAVGGVLGAWFGNSRSR